MPRESSVRLRPEVYEADRLDALCLHLVEGPDAGRLLFQVAVELVEARAPVAQVRLELAALFLVKRQRDLLVAAFVPAELPRIDPPGRQRDDLRSARRP